VTGFKPPKKRPGNVEHLRLLVQSYAGQDTAIRRVQLLISTMAFVGALARVGEEDTPARFLIKGGMALELRMPGKARATKDVDAIFHGSLDELLADLDEAFKEPYSGFSFRYTDPVEIRATAVHRFEVKLDYEGKSWATLRVEVSPPEGGGHEPDRVPAISLSHFLLDGPEWVACLSLRYQIAQKLHAVSERFDDRENDRVRDLLDLLLMRDLTDDLKPVREACLEIFTLRDSHPWLPTITLEPSWPAEYPRLAAELDFPVTDAEEAIAEVHAFIAAIDAAS
jgi:hypothetical protein